MSTIEIAAKIAELQELEALIEEARAEADSIRDTIKAEMNSRGVEEMEVGTHIVRYTTVLSNRFDSTAFKKVMPDVYKAYTKQLEAEVGKWHKAYDTLIIERNALVSKLAKYESPVTLSQEEINGAQG